MSPAGPLVEYAVEDRVALVTLNRPDRLNAWTPDLGAEYLDRLEDAAVDPAVRAIVVTGAGRGFCAGADMQDLGDIGPGKPPRVVDDRPHTLPRTIPKPIIAAVNGPCAGLGMTIAACCDLRFAAAGAKFTTAFARRGLVAEYGISWILGRIVGPAKALDLLLSARVVLAEEALELGLVDRVFPVEEVLDRALDYARDLARFCSPASMATIKRQLFLDGERGEAESYAEALAVMRASFDLPDLAEGVASYEQSRPPEFPPLDPEVWKR